MFPLGTVLLPHQPLPLHVFEPRYRALVHDCMAGDRTFGVVLIERGHEVGGGDTRFDTGCTAEIVQAEEAPDGRWTLVTTGRTPLRVRTWLPDDPYPVAEVTLVEEAWDEAAEAAFELARDRFRVVVDLARQAGYAITPDVLDLPGEAMWDHWILCARAPVGDLDRLALLRADGPADRLVLLEDQLAGVEAVLASRLSGG